MVQVTGMVTHNLTHMVQSVVLKKGIYEKGVRLKQKIKNTITNAHLLFSFKRATHPFT